MHDDLHVGVLDDLRELPPHMHTDTTVHCKTVEEWIPWLDSVEGETLVVILDHDLGGEAFGVENSKEGIKELVQRHIDGRIDIVVAYVVTMNPAGQRWIISELERGEIDFDIDVGGKQIGMICPDWLQ